jgi:hypothetical protein
LFRFINNTRTWWFSVTANKSGETILKKRVIGVGLVFFLLLSLLSVTVSSEGESDAGTCVLKITQGIKCLEIYRSHPLILDETYETPEEVCAEEYLGNLGFVPTLFFDDGKALVLEKAAEGNTSAMLINNTCYSGCCRCENADDEVTACYSDFSYTYCADKCEGDFPFLDLTTARCPLDCANAPVVGSISGSVSILGVVNDDDSEALPDKVLVKINELGLTTQADAPGYGFMFPNVPLGEYSLEATAYPFSGVEGEIVVTESGIDDVNINMGSSHIGSILVIATLGQGEDEGIKLSGFTAILSYAEGATFKCITNASGMCWIEVFSVDETEFFSVDKYVIFGKWGFDVKNQEVDLEVEDNVAVAQFDIESLQLADIQGNVEFTGIAPGSYEASLDFPASFISVGVPLDVFVPEKNPITDGLSSFTFNNIYFPLDHNITISVSAPNYYTNSTTFKVTSDVVTTAKDDGVYPFGELTLYQGGACSEGTQLNQCTAALNGYFCAAPNLPPVQDCRGYDDEIDTIDDCCSAGYACEDQSTVEEEIFICVSVSEAASCASDCTFVGDDFCHADCDGFVGPNNDSCVFDDTTFFYNDGSICDTTEGDCSTGGTSAIDFLDGKAKGLHAISFEYVIQGCEGKFMPKEDASEGLEVCHDMKFEYNDIVPLDNNPDDDIGPNCQHSDCKGKACMFTEYHDNGAPFLNPGICRTTSSVGEPYSGVCSPECEYRNCEGDKYGNRTSYIGTQYEGLVFGNIVGPCMCGNNPLNYLGTSPIPSTQGPFCFAGYVDPVTGVQGLVTDTYGHCENVKGSNECFKQDWSCCSNGCADETEARTYSYFSTVLGITLQESNPCGNGYSGLCCAGECKASMPASQCCALPFMCDEEDYAQDHFEQEGCGPNSYACSTDCNVNFPDCNIDVKKMLKEDGSFEYLIGDKYNPKGGHIDAITLTYPNFYNSDQLACVCGDEVLPIVHKNDVDNIAGACCSTESGQASYPVFFTDDSGEYQCAQYPKKSPIEGVVKKSSPEGVDEGPLMGINGAKAIIENFDTTTSYFSDADNLGRFSISLPAGKYFAKGVYPGYKPYNDLLVYFEVIGEKYYLADFDGASWGTDMADENPNLVLFLTERNFECNYSHAVSNFNGSHIKGVKSVRLNWTPTCYGFPVSHYVLVRKNLDEDTQINITVPLSKIVQNSPSEFYFIDDGDLFGLPAPLWDTNYEYRITKVFVQANQDEGAGAGQDSGTAITLFRTGNVECQGKTLYEVEDQQFCVNGVRQVCSDTNLLATEYSDAYVFTGNLNLQREDYPDSFYVFEENPGPVDCTNEDLLDNGYCASVDGKAYCRIMKDCGTKPENVFALFSKENKCLGLEKVPIGEISNLCYFDYSRSNKDDCFSCLKFENTKVMTDEENNYYDALGNSPDPFTHYINCYDYNSEYACNLDSCGAGEYRDDETNEILNVECRWYNVSSSEFGKGFCYPVGLDSLDKSYLRNNDYTDDLFDYRRNVVLGTGDTETLKGKKTCNLCDSRLNIFENIDCSQEICDRLGDCYSVVEGAEHNETSTPYVSYCDIEYGWNACLEGHKNTTACRCVRVQGLLSFAQSLMLDHLDYEIPFEYSNLDDYLLWINDQVSSNGCNFTSLQVGVTEPIGGEPVFFNETLKYVDFNESLSSLLKSECEVNKDKNGALLRSCVELAKTYPVFVNLYSYAIGSCGIYEEDVSLLYEKVDEKIELLSSFFNASPYPLSYCTSCDDSLYGMCNNYVTEKSCEGVGYDPLIYSFTSDFVEDSMYGAGLSYPQGADFNSEMVVSLDDFTFDEAFVKITFNQESLQEAIDVENDLCTDNETARDIYSGENQEQVQELLDVLKLIEQLQDNISAMDQDGSNYTVMKLNYEDNQSRLAIAMVDNETYWDLGGNLTYLFELEGYYNDSVDTYNLAYIDVMNAAPDEEDDFISILVQAELDMEQKNASLQTALLYYNWYWMVPEGVDSYEYLASIQGEGALYNLTVALSNYSEAYQTFVEINNSYNNNKSAKINNETYRDDLLNDTEGVPYIYYYDYYLPTLVQCNYSEHVEEQNNAKMGAIKLVAFDEELSFQTTVDVNEYYKYNLTFKARSDLDPTRLMINLNGYQASSVNIGNHSDLITYQVRPFFTPGVTGLVNLTFTFKKNPIYYYEDDVRLTISDITLKPEGIQGLRFPSDDACGLSACKWSDEFGFCFKDGNDDDLPDCHVHDKADDAFGSNFQPEPPTNSDIWKTCNQDNIPPAIIDNLGTGVVGRDGYDVKFYAVDPVLLETMSSEQLIIDFEAGSEDAIGEPISKIWFCIDRYDFCDPFNWTDYNLNTNEDEFGDSVLDYSLGQSVILANYYYHESDTSKNLVQAFMTYLEDLKGGELSIEDAGTYYLRYTARDKNFNLMPIRSSSIMLDMVAPHPKLKFIHTGSDNQKIIHNDSLSFEIYSEIPGDVFYCSVNLTKPDRSPEDYWAEGLNPDDSDGWDRITEHGEFFGAYTGLGDGYHTLDLHCWDDADNHNNTKYLVYIDTNANIQLVFPQPGQVLGWNYHDFYVVLTTIGNSTCTYNGKDFHTMKVDEQLEGFSNTHRDPWLSLLSVAEELQLYTGEGVYSVPGTLFHPVTNAPVSLNDVNLPLGGYVHMMHSSRINEWHEPNLLNSGEGYSDDSRYYPPSSEGKSGLAHIYCTDQETHKDDSIELFFTYDRKSPLSIITVGGAEGFTLNNTGNESQITTASAYIKSGESADLSISCQDKKIFNVDETVYSPNDEIGAQVFGCDQTIVDYDVDEFPASSCFEFRKDGGVGVEWETTTVSSYPESLDIDVVSTTVLIFKSSDHDENDEYPACLQLLYDLGAPDLDINYSFEMGHESNLDKDVTDKSIMSVEFFLGEDNPRDFIAYYYPAGDGENLTLHNYSHPNWPDKKSYGSKDLTLESGLNHVYAILVDEVGRFNESELYVYYDDVAPAIGSILLRDLTRDPENPNVCGNDGYTCSVPRVIEYGHPFEVLIFVNDTQYTALTEFNSYQNNTVKAIIKDADLQSMYDIFPDGFADDNPPFVTMSINETLCSQNNYCNQTVCVEGEDCSDPLCSWVVDDVELCDEHQCFPGSFIELQGETDVYDVCYVNTTTWSSTLDYSFVDDLIELEYVTDELYSPAGLGPYSVESVFNLRPYLMELGEDDKKFMLMPSSDYFYEPAFDKWIFDYPWKAGDYYVDIKALDRFDNPTEPFDLATNTRQTFKVEDTVFPEMRMEITESSDGTVLNLSNTSLIESLENPVTYNVTFIADELLFVNDGFDCSPMFSINPLENLANPLDLNMISIECDKNRCALQLNNLKNLFGVNLNNVPFNFVFKGCDLNENYFEYGLGNDDYVQELFRFKVDTRGLDKSIALPWIRARDINGNSLPETPETDEVYHLYSLDPTLSLIGFIPGAEGLEIDAIILNHTNAQMPHVYSTFNLKPMPGPCHMGEVEYIVENESFGESFFYPDLQNSHEVGSAMFAFETGINLEQGDKDLSECFVGFNTHHIMNNFLRYNVSEYMFINDFLHQTLGDSDADDYTISLLNLSDNLTQPIKMGDSVFNFYNSEYPENWFNFTEELPYTNQELNELTLFVRLAETPSYNRMNLVVEYVNDTFGPDILSPLLVDLSPEPAEYCDSNLICEYEDEPAIEYGHGFEVIIPVNDSEYTFYFEQDNMVWAAVNNSDGYYLGENEYAYLHSVDSVGSLHFDKSTTFRLGINDTFLIPSGDYYNISYNNRTWIDEFNNYAYNYSLKAGTYKIYVLASDTFSNNNTAELEFEVVDTVAPEFVVDVFGGSSEFNYTEDALEAGYIYNISIIANDFLITDLDNDNAPTLMMSGAADLDLSVMLNCSLNYCLVDDLLNGLSEQYDGVADFTFEACDLNGVCNTTEFSIILDTVTKDLDIPLPWLKGEQKSGEDMPMYPESHWAGNNKVYEMKTFGDSITFTGILYSDDEDGEFELEIIPYNKSGGLLEWPNATKVNLSDKPTECMTAQSTSGYQVACDQLPDVNLGIGGNKFYIEDSYLENDFGDCKYVKFSEHHSWNDFLFYELSSFLPQHSVHMKFCTDPEEIDDFTMVTLTSQLKQSIAERDSLSFYSDQDPMYRFSATMPLWEPKGDHKFKFKVKKGSQQMNIMMLKVDNIPDNAPPAIEGLMLRDSSTNNSCSPGRNDCGDEIALGHSFDVIIFVNDTDYASLVPPNQTVNVTIWYPPSNGSVLVENETLDYVNFLDSGSEVAADIGYLDEYAFVYNVTSSLINLGNHNGYDMVDYTIPAGNYTVEVKATDVFGEMTTEYLYFSVVDYDAPEFDINVSYLDTELDFTSGDEMLSGESYDISIVASEFLSTDTAKLTLTSSDVEIDLSSSLYCVNNTCEASYDPGSPIPLNFNGAMTLIFEAEDTNGVLGVYEMTVIVDNSGYDNSVPLPWIVGVSRDLEESPYYSEEAKFPMLVVQEDNLTLTGFIPFLDDGNTYSYKVWYVTEGGVRVNTTDKVSLPSASGDCPTAPGDYQVAATNVAGEQFSHSSGSNKFGVESTDNLAGLPGCYSQFTLPHENNNWLNYLVSDYSYVDKPHWKFGEPFVEEVTAYSSVTLDSELKEGINVTEPVTFYSGPQPNNWFNYSLPLNESVDKVELRIYKDGTRSFNLLYLDIMQVGEFGQYRIRNITPKLDSKFSFVSDEDNFVKTITFEVPLPSKCHLKHSADTTAEEFDILVEGLDEKRTDGWFKYSHTIGLDRCKPDGEFYQIGVKEEKPTKFNYHSFTIECTQQFMGTTDAPVCYKFDTVNYQHDTVSDVTIYDGVPDICDAEPPAGSFLVTECKKDCTTSYFDHESCVADSECAWCPGSVEGFSGKIAGGICVNWDTGSDECIDCFVGSKQFKYDRRPDVTFEGIPADEAERICDDVENCGTCDGVVKWGGCLCDSSCRKYGSLSFPGISDVGHIDYGLFRSPLEDNGVVECGGVLDCKNDFPTLNYDTTGDYHTSKDFKINKYDSGDTPRDADYPGYDAGYTKTTPAGYNLGIYMKTVGVDARCELCENEDARYYVNNCNSNECANNPYNNDHRTNSWDDSLDDGEGNWGERAPPYKNIRNNICDNIPSCGDSFWQCFGFDNKCRCSDAYSNYPGYIVLEDEHPAVPDTYTGVLLNCGGYTNARANALGLTDCGKGVTDCYECS